MAIPFRPDPPITLGLLGGVASGKSTVAKLFGAHGLECLDADEVAHRVLELPEILAAVRDRFGAAVFGEDGHLDRPRLGEVVFSDRGRLRDLEAITHPRIRAELERRLDEAVDSGRSVVLDIPLLIEGGWVDRCDACVFVDADAATRRSRAVERGWSPDELERREQNQTELGAKRAASRYTVRSSGSLRQTRRDVAAVIEDLRIATMRPRPRD